MPGWFARAVRSMRGLVMTLTFVGGIAATFLGGVTFVAGLSDKPSASSLLKFLVAAGGVPVAIIAGVVGAEKERQLIRRKAAEKFKKEGETWLKAITNVTMDGYRTRMDTWIAETERDWVDAVGAWWEDVISPAVARAQEAATKRVADHKARSDEIAKQITAVTTLRGKATQVLASLRYRHQELRLGNAQPTPDDEPEPG